MLQMQSSGILNLCHIRLEITEKSSEFVRLGALFFQSAIQERREIDKGQKISWNDVAPRLV
jgi:hypothetical protein